MECSVCSCDVQKDIDNLIYLLPDVKEISSANEVLLPAIMDLIEFREILRGKECKAVG